MVSIVGITVVSGIIVLVGIGWYVERQLSKSFDIEIFEDEAELINMFKDGLRNSCWEDSIYKEDNASR